MQIHLYHIFGDLNLMSKWQRRSSTVRCYVTSFNMENVGHREICAWTGVHAPAAPCLSVKWPTAPPCGDSLQTGIDRPCWAVRAGRTLDWTNKNCQEHDEVSPQNKLNKVRCWQSDCQVFSVTKIGCTPPGTRTPEAPRLLSQQRWLVLLKLRSHYHICH